jgi:hypothetical protein
MLNSRKNKLTLVLAITLLAFVFPQNSYAAASLYLSPTVGTYRIGQSFSMNVNVSSPSQAINAVSGSISFSQEYLEVTSVSKAGSIISFWVQEPVYSNNAGNINFEGVIPNPGYQGSGGRLISVSFRAKASGVASVRLVSGSVLANDGAGTNILSGLGSASFNLGTVPGAEQPPTTTTPPKPVEQGTLPPAPVISSLTHPNPDKWYSNNNPTFEWVLPAGVTGVRVLGDRNADTDPGTKSDGMIQAHKYTNIEDGVWYFHAKFKNAKGWGPVTHFKFQVDKTPPKGLEITRYSNTKVAGASVGSVALGSTSRFVFKAMDDQSGVERYVALLDGKDVSGEKELKTLEAGSHVLVVEAYDKAGNSSSEQIQFEVPHEGDNIKIDFKFARFAFWLLFSIVLAGILAYFGRKLPRSFRRRRSISKDALEEDIEILEKIGLERELTPEESLVLSNLKHSYYDVKGNSKFNANLSGRTVNGYFNGERMVGSDNKLYDVPKNYASKSKLVEGDMLRLIYTDKGHVYKQVGPISREKKHGLVIEDGADLRIVVGDKAYKVLPASVSFFKIKVGDEVEVYLPKGRDAEWAVIDNLIETKSKKEELGREK